MSFQNKFPRETVEQRATVPETDFFLPTEAQREQASQEFRTDVSDLSREDAIIITHNDADGLTSGAYMADWFETVTDQSAKVYPTSYHGAFDLTAALETLNNHVRVIPKYVFITDLGASTFETAEPEIKALHPDAEVIWIDHHQWDDSQYSDLISCAHGIIDESVCATQLVIDLRNGNANGYVPLESDGAPEPQVELADIVNDHDLWIKEDPRSDDVATFAEYADNGEYMNAALNGVDLLHKYETTINAYKEEKQQLQEFLVDEAGFITTAGQRVAATYGYGPSSAAGNELVEGQDADIAVIIRPDGSLSIYAHSNEDGFTQCHEVAERLGGGGHPTAAGGSLSIDTFDEFVALWDSRGDEYIDHVLDKIAGVVWNDE